MDEVGSVDEDGFKGLGGYGAGMGYEGVIRVYLRGRICAENV